MDKPVTDYRLQSADLILTPSRLFFEHQKSQYLDKTIQYFYCFNENYLPELANKFQDRKQKILLSGANYYTNGVGYPIRNHIYGYWQKNKQNKDSIGEYIDYLSHPSYDRLLNGDKSGINYYKILASYRGAFFGFAAAPQNYVLAKIIEILSCGCIGFFEYSPLLEKDLGLIKFKHYVPIMVDENNVPMYDRDYYLKYLLGSEGEKIANEGYKYVINKFNMKNKCDELHNILKTKIK